ncbi:substrate-binding periplasmic protein [Megalodesulfovibrio paquesii]
MCTAKTHLLVAVPSLAPWQWMRAGQAQGPDAELLAALARKLDFLPEWIPLAAPDNLAPLQEGRADIIAGVADSVRLATLLQCFTTPHRIQGPLHIYVRKDAAQPLQSEADIPQFRMGLADGVRLPAAESPAGRSPMRGSLADLLPALNSGRLDALAAEAESGQRFLPILPAGVVKAPLEIAPMPLFVCLSRQAPLVVRFEEIEPVYQDLLE